MTNQVTKAPSTSDSCTGRFKNGTVVLSEPVAWPDDAEVQVKLIQYDRPIGEFLLDWAGQVDDLPEDVASRHDHYLTNSD